VTRTALGFVGLGNMGQPIASRIVTAGYELVCFDAAGTAERLPAAAQSVGSVMELAQQADTVLLSLPDGPATLAVADVIASASERRTATVIDLSTIGPTAAAEAAARLADAGVAYADGPVSGGVAGARAGTLAVMFAGDSQVLEAQRHVLRTFAANVFDVGTQPGQGQAMKLLNNFLSATALVATSEAMALGRAHGLDMTMMLDVLNSSTGRNSATVDKFPHRIVTGTYDAGFLTSLMAKDLQLYLEMAERAGPAGTVSLSVSDVWQRADAALPGSDFTRIWEFVAGR
jgi:3-hydroxyisobutyrate dehydrogenase-like beta-hydroxyacid dehydrogenase